MKDPLADCPNDDRTIFDDHEARTFLLQIGIFGNLGQSSLPGSSVKIYKHTSHPTHWIVACRFYGNNNPADNGYAVYCFPKSRFGPEEMDKCERYIQKTTEGGDGYSFEINPNRN